MSLNGRKILLLDDHPLILSGICVLLSNANAIVETARSISEALALLEQRSFDLCILDINLGKEFGFDLLATDHAYRMARVVAFSGITEQEVVFECFRLGASGFISKNTPPEDLIQAIIAMFEFSPKSGGGWIWCAERKSIVDVYDYFPKETVLTPKEREVFLLMREGLLDKQIADTMDLSIHTVRVHIRAIKRKRGHNRRFEQNL